MSYNQNEDNWIDKTIDSALGIAADAYLIHFTLENTSIGDKIKDNYNSHYNGMTSEAEDFDIPEAPVDVDNNGEAWIECENPVEVEA